MRRARGWGRGRRHRLFVFPGSAAQAGRHRGKAAGTDVSEARSSNLPEAARRALFLRPCVPESGAQGTGLRSRRQDAASGFVLPEVAGGLPSPDAAIRGPRGLRRLAAPSAPLPPAARHKQPGAFPQPALLTLRPREPGSRTTPARWGPGRALRGRRAGNPRAAAAGWSRRRRWRRRRRGVLLCSRSSPERGRDTPELGRRGEGGGGGSGGGSSAEGRAARAARGARPSSPHPSTGRGSG